jgi:hypothetical protein
LYEGGLNKLLKKHSSATIDQAKQFLAGYLFTTPELLRFNEDGTIDRLNWQGTTGCKRLSFTWEKKGKRIIVQ